LHHQRSDDELAHLPLRACCNALVEILPQVQESGDALYLRERLGA
jgi:hypothetical protein